MKTQIVALLLSIIVLAGCVTDEISVKTTLDPQATHTMESAIYVYAQTDMLIDDRKYFLEVPEILKELGLNVTSSEEADYVMFLKFQEGLKYKPKREEFEYDIETYKIFYGIIDAGLFKLTDSKQDFINKSEWIGFVEINDIRERAQLKRSLEILVDYLTKDVNMNVPLQGGDLAQPVGGADRAH
jgi:hypothetical protein